MSASASYFVVALVIVARFVAPLFIPRWPLPAILACLVIDAVDQTVFQTFTTFDLAGYQSYDKALDVYYLVIAYLSTLRNWQNRDAFVVSRFLLYYRLAGVVLFELLQLRPLLLVFPNTFEYFFIFIHTVRSRWNSRQLSRRTIWRAAAAIWVFIKLPQEYWIHIARLDVTDLLKQAFGVAPDAPWGVAIAQRPWVALAVLGAGLAVAALIRYALLPHLPPPQHRLRLAAQPVPPEVDEPQEKRAVYAATSKPWNPVTLEKVALIGMVSIIFGQILPGFNASPLRLILSVAVVVIINAWISYTLARHDLGFGHVWKQFGLLLAVNLSLGAVGLGVLARRENPADVANTVFLLLLLTLLVTLYDRFRPIYAVRFEQGAFSSPSDALE